MDIDDESYKENVEKIARRRSQAAEIMANSSRGPRTETFTSGTVTVNHGPWSELGSKNDITDQTWQEYENFTILRLDQDRW